MTTRTRWVVRRGEGTRLGDLLARAKVDACAVKDGRVFIGRRRARSPDDAVRVGDEIFVAAKAEPAPPVTILADQDGLVAVDKPADMVTIPDQGDAEASLIASVARALGVAVASLHATSRLDRGVSGVVVFARTPDAAERLRVAREQGTYARRYVAIAATAPIEPHGEWDAPIGRAKDPRHRAPFGKDAAPALSRYAIAGRAAAWALLALEPGTGRTHQLRVHASHAGAPLLGDRVYGGPPRVTLATGRVMAFGRIALHAARVRVPRPDGAPLEIAAPVPQELREWWRAGTGEDGAWDAALRELTALRA